jgi:NADH-quinone oxidoreductase subunit L
MAAILILAIIGLPWLGAMCVWLVGDQRSRTQHLLAVCFSIAAGLAALALLPFVSATTVIRIPAGNFFGDLTFVADGLGAFLAAVATIIGSLAVIFSMDYMKGEEQLGRYYSFILFFIGAMAGLVLTSSLLFLFVFWEITALTSYALISFYNDDPKAVAGGIKALIITQVGGVGMLAGALAAYTNTGSYEIGVFLEKAHTLPAATLSVIAFGFLIAAAAKSAQTPFHTWLPDAMEAPTPVSALIHAATMVNAGVYVLARFYPAFEGVPGWRTAVILVGSVSALLAALMALVANDLKRVLAYSTISQLVYAIGVGGVFASQFHLLSHSVFKALLFLAAGAVIHSVGTRDMRQMGGLGKEMPFTRSVFIIGGLALAGLPILNGFWSKELVLEAGLLGGPIWAFGLMVFVAGLTAFYTYRMSSMVFGGSSPAERHFHDAGQAMKVSLGLLAFGTLTTWLLAGPFGQILSTSLPAHHVHAAGTWSVAEEVVTAPATVLALGVIALGLAAWHWRKHLAWLDRLLGGFGQLASDGFGFENLNRGIVNATLKAADTIRPLQTGLLNWNVVGILGGLVVVLAWLAWSTGIGR